MIQFVALSNKVTPYHLGLIPTFLNEHDPRPAVEQIDSNYAHGGGWHDFDGFHFDKENLTLTYPGDPVMRPLAAAKLHGNEYIVIYPSAWVVVLNEKDGTHRVCRVD